MVRRLPVLQNQAPEDAEAAARPRWHWVVIGAGLSFTIWLPLAVLALWLGRLLSGMTLAGDAPETAAGGQRVLHALALVVPVLGSFALASAAGSALVGRFGGRAGPREAALGSAAAGALAALIALLGGGVGSWLVTLLSGAILALVGALAGLAGGRFGHKKRPRL